MWRGDDSTLPRCTTACAALALLAAAATSACGDIEAPSSAFGDETHADRRGPARHNESALHDVSYPTVRCADPTGLLVHHDSAGRVDRVHAALTARGLSGPYLVDTGSLASFTTNVDAEEAKSASTVLSCTETTLPIIG